MDTTSKKYTPQQIHDMLLTNDRAVERAVVAIWKKQTAIERLNQVTMERNGVGYSAFDAGFMGSLAERLEYKKLGLTSKQLAAARKTIVHYVGQLTRLANGEI